VRRDRGEPRVVIRPDIDDGAALNGSTLGAGAGSKRARGHGARSEARRSI